MATAGTQVNITTDTQILELTEAMLCTPIMRGTSPDSVRDLASRGTLRNFRKGSYLFHEEDQADDVLFLFEGRVEISSLSPNGQKQWHTAMEPPAFLGELGVLGEMPRTASGLALEPCKVWTISGDTFLGFLADHPVTARALIRALARQIDAYGSLVDDLLFLDLRGRVAKRLIGLVSRRLDRPAPDGSIVPVITHADLASLAGGSRENVTRILSELQRRGVIDRAGRRYVINDMTTLRRLAGL